VLLHGGQFGRHGFSPMRLRGFVPCTTAEVAIDDLRRKAC
jgi:hypothetical protein